MNKVFAWVQFSQCLSDLLCHLDKLVYPKKRLLIISCMGCLWYDVICEWNSSQRIIVLKEPVPRRSLHNLQSGQNCRRSHDLGCDFHLSIPLLKAFSFGCIAYLVFLDALSAESQFVSHCPILGKTWLIEAPTTWVDFEATFIDWVEAHLFK